VTVSFLFKYNCKFCHGAVTLDEGQVSIVFCHDLAGDAETNAGASLFGGVERHEDLVDLP
jgi:hypothetical protein